MLNFLSALLIFWELAWNNFLIGLYIQQVFSCLRVSHQYYISNCYIYIFLIPTVSLSQTWHCTQHGVSISISSSTRATAQVLSPPRVPCQVCQVPQVEVSDSGSQSTQFSSWTQIFSLSSEVAAEPLQELQTECYYPQHAGSNGLDWGRINNTNTGRAAKIISI